MSSGVLNVIGGADRGKRYDLNLPENRIGRGADQDIVLSDIAVSRRHITVLQEGPRFRLRDLGSGNGTLVNGQRIDTVLLNDGDHIELGNTVLRFNQQGAAAAQGPPNYASQPPGGGPPMSAGFGPPPSGQSYGAPAPYVPPAPAPYIPPTPPPIAQLPMPQPMQAAMTQMPQVIGAPTQAPFASPAMAAPRAAVPRVSAGRRAVDKGPLDTPIKKALVFGGLGLFCALGVTLIVSRTVFAKPQVVASDAEESYKQGLRMFSSGDFEGAKVNFNDAATQAPDAPEPKRYLKQCDSELRARGSLKAAERAQAARHYSEAVRDAEQVEDGTLSHDQAARVKKEAAPRAAIEEVEEAKRVLATDPSAAQALLSHALELDPGNAEARALLPRIKSGKPVVVAVVKEPVSEPPPKPAHVVKEKPLVPLVKEPKPAPGPAVSVGESKGAMALYKNKDFAGAVRQARVEAMGQPPKQSDKTMALMNQLKLVQAAVERAAGEEARSPAEAVKDYNEAMSLDQKIAKGVNGSYFKQKIGKLQIASAQQSFQQGKYDQAYQSALLAQKYGAGDGGMMKQLESKAGELVQKGQGVQKSNVNQAKSYWRMVCKMVPTSSPVYAKAYGLINNASGPAKDEDEN